MDWRLADGHADSGGVSDRMFRVIRRLVEARKAMPALHASVATDVFTTDNPTVLVFRRRHAAGSVVQIYNLSETVQFFDGGVLWPLTGDVLFDHVTGAEIQATPRMAIPPYGAWWLTSVS
jgi:amylosucrase